MDNIKSIAEFFLISLGLTFTLFSPIAKSTLTGNGFIKLISNLSIGALIISLIINLVSGGQILTHLNLLKILSIISLILISLFHKDQKSILMWVLYSIIITTLTYHIFQTAQMNVINFSFLMSSSLFLGVITYAMVLGHWYLVVPKLSEKPLATAALITWIILALKIFISTKSILGNLDFFAENTSLGSGYAFNWVLLLMRVLFGYVVILGMSIFNWRLVKMRSIQSSTGVLYAMTFFVFIGELISSYMFFNYGLFI
jgi:hypothetical protein